MSLPNLVLETKTYNFSTGSSAGIILNTDTNFKSLIQYTIPDMVVRDEAVEYINFSVPYAVIPVSFFIINNNNCNLVVMENGITTTYVFPYGNYTASLFMTKFKEILGVNWTITLNNINSTFTITNSAGNFSILGTSTMDYILGFSGTQTSVIDSTNQNTLTMPRCCNFFPLPRVFIRCSELASGNMVGSFSRGSDIILSIPNNAKPNGQLYYQNQSGAKMLYRGNFLNRFTISFTDEKNQLINFNGVSSFFTFQFDIYRTYVPKPPPFYNVLNYVNSMNTMQDLEKQSIEQNMTPSI